MAGVQLMRVLRAGVALALGAFIALAGAQPATAAGELELSPDGVSYSTALASPLFATAPVLVPLDSASSTFWVRNSSASAAYLRITLDDSSWSSAEYGSSLRVSASVPSKAGTAVPLASNPPCSIILSGVLLAPGQAVAVTATVAMIDVNGTSAQLSWAAIDLGVTLTESGGLAASSDCSTPTTPVVVVSPPRGVVVPGVVAEPTATPATPAPPAPTDEEEAEPEEPDSFLAVLTNTLAAFDTGVIALAGASIPAGAALFLLVGFSRRALDKYRDDEGE